MRYTAYSGEQDSSLGVFVISCGHIFAKPGREIDRPSGRSDSLLFYVAKGREKFRLGEEIIAETGDFILFHPGEPQQHICVSDKPSEFYYIHFQESDGFFLTSLQSSRIYHTDGSPTIHDLFEDVIAELQMKQPRYERIAVCRLLELTALLERQVMGSPNKKSEYIDRIARVIRTMHTDLAEHHSLDDYASICSMSKFHFVRVFTSITGTSPAEYRNTVRIEHAKELLLDTALSVKEIGERVGYTSPPTFCDAFKRRVGTSPTEFRKSGGI